MARKAPERPLLPQVVPSNFAGLVDWTGTLVRQLVATFQDLGFRANAAFVRDGSERMEGPLPLARYDLADLPPAEDWEGAMVYVNDGGAGQRLRYSDGSSWVVAG